MTRFPWAPLESLLRGNVSEMARVLEVAPKQLYRWRRYGLEAEHAERCALVLGRTPWELWPDEWLRDATKACEARGCEARFVPSRRTQRFCSSVCSHREYQRGYYRRRYHSDPEFAAAEIARRQAHYAACLDYELAYHKRRYQAKKVA